MISYSFIIPHKNTPELLQKCLDTIPRRDDVQIIVVDDNSDPDKVDFDRFPGKDDPSVEVYLTKEGKGAGYARNVGLGHAVGKWLVFADADDYFNPCIGEAMDKYVDTDYDVVFFKGNAVKLSDGTPSGRGELMNAKIDKALSTGDYNDLLLISSPCRKFIKRQLIVVNNILFNVVQWSNDVVFSSKVAVAAKRYCASDMVIYCITESDMTLTHDWGLKCQLVRFREGCRSHKIIRNKIDASGMYYWTFFSWLGVYKRSKLVAAAILPRAIWTYRWPFVQEMLKAKFSR